MPAAAPMIADRLSDPLGRLFLQLALIVVAARVLGALARRLGQPPVIGEMVAGLLLGPSLAGRVAPSAWAFVFPPASMGTLALLSQTGVCIFLFVVGMDLEVAHLRHRARQALVVSPAGIAVPYALGVGVALLLFPRLAAPGTSRTAFALFLGIAMSITAFPVLARILDERGLSKTPLGALAIACAAIDDVAAWSILAVVVAIATASGLAHAALTVGLVGIYVATMLLVVRRVVPRWIGARSLEGGEPGKGVLAGVVAFLLLSALATEAIGVHALFGAFLAGVVMPRHGAFRDGLRLRIDEFSSVFLLPIFFAFTGLRTELALLADPAAWGIAALLILLATAGKLGGVMVAGRIAGLAWGEAFDLGALMNARGLMELVVLNLGLDLGILSPSLFAMLVLMAVVTTLSTGPLLTAAARWRGPAPAIRDREAGEPQPPGSREPPSQA